ncbi:MAG: alginate export family protein [Candidatus Omnitrophota bacterium]|nr:alginate export family protein [Candidatus Omnitrophota bacterium]
MSKFLKLMSVLAIVALIAVPAFAEVQNVKVSGDIDSKIITRSNYDFINGNNTDTDTWFNTVTRVQIDADLTDNVSTSVRLLNERDWDTEPAPGANTPGDTAISLDLASVKLKEMFYAPLTLTIGRQLLRFGSGLVVGDPDSNDTSINAAIEARDLSARKSFDAIRATFDYNPLVLDVIFAKISANTIGGSATTGRNRDDADLSGINAAYKFDKYNSEVEAYVFANHTKQGNLNLESNQVYTYGVRGSLEPISKLVVNAELATQQGDYRTAGPIKLDRSAWAADAGASYAIDYKWSPKVALNYIYRSGQKQGGNDADDDTTGVSKYKAWDTSFEDQTHGIVANSIFDGNNDGVDSNGSTINLMAAVVPLQDLTVALDYYYYRLAQKWTDLDVVTRNTTTGAYAVRNDKNLGQEVDLSLGYDYTEDVKLGLTAGYFLPGKTFLKDNNDPATTVMADVKVSF